MERPRIARPAAAPTYRLVAASTGTVRQSLSSSGTIEPAVQDELNFAVSAVRSPASGSQAGQKVAAGAVLATVDSASLRADLAQAQASLASRPGQGRVPTPALRPPNRRGQRSLTAAQGQVSSAQTALAEADLTSPIAGVVASVDLTVGQQVSGSASGSNGSGGSGSGGSGSSGVTAGSPAPAGSSSSTSRRPASTAQVLK